MLLLVFVVGIVVAGGELLLCVFVAVVVYTCVSVVCVCWRC